MSVKIKICGITRREDAVFAEQCGADYLGFVFAPASARRVGLERIADLTAGLKTKKVGVFVNADLPFIRKAVTRGRLDVVQLHGDESPDFAEKIDFAEVWKATYQEDFPAAKLICDAPRGGSGQFGDHAKAAELSRRRKIMLAGGITPENAVELIRKVHPDGIDLSSGVEHAPGIKDHRKISELFKQVKGMES
ncbi:MAG: phosphoribosylanthranilate isomerase [Lentisphaeria bacterium]|nr:phosphoribosylanthranilate isomerase [Lentisphaeria bacterium]